LFAGFKTLFVVGLGGFLGAVCRFYVSGVFTRGDFPLGTLMVNVLGSVFLGFVMFASFYLGYFSVEVRNFFAVGFLGSFTTMSTFSFETVEFLSEQNFFAAGLNVLFNLGLSLIGVYVGRWLALFLGGV